MKKLSILAILAIVGLGIIGCDDKHYYDQNPLNEVKGFYETPHQLRKMFVKDKEVTVKEPGRGNLSGGFFLLIGGISGDFKEGTEAKYISTYVQFAWEIKDNTYIITTLPLDKVRIKLTDKAEPPTVSFFLNEFAVNKEFDKQRPFGKTCVDQNLRRILTNYYDPNEALAEYLAYVTFTVRSDDWPSNINLPVNQGYNKQAR